MENDVEEIHMVILDFEIFFLEVILDDDKEVILNVWMEENFFFFYNFISMDVNYCKIIQHTLAQEDDWL